VDMGRGTTSKRVLPIIIPRLDDAATASIDDLDEHLMLLEAARHGLDVEWTETLVAAEATRAHDAMGYPTMVAYLKDRMKMAGGRANRYVRNARTALKHAATLSAWKHRQISGDEAELMFRAAERTPDEYPEAESVLLELVGDGLDETRKVLDYWRADVDLPGVKLHTEQQLARRRFDVARRPNGMVAGEFELPGAEAEGLLTAVDALMPPPRDDDERTTTQRRADALGDLARTFLEGSETPIVGGERPHIVVHVDHEGLQAKGGGLHETEDGFVLDPFAVSQLACDSTVTRIVFGPDSEVLDYGRTTRTVSQRTPPGCHRSRPPLRRLRLWPVGEVVRRTPHHMVGRWRRNCHRQPLSFVQVPPHEDAPRVTEPRGLGSTTLCNSSRSHRMYLGADPHTKITQATAPGPAILNSATPN
jgi:Domain of unknown function (DUF222)